MANHIEFVVVVALAVATVFFLFFILFNLFSFFILHIMYIYFATTLGVLLQLCPCQSQQLPPQIYFYNFTYYYATLFCGVNLFSVKCFCHKYENCWNECCHIRKQIEAYLKCWTFASATMQTDSLSLSSNKKRRQYNNSCKINLNVSLMNVYSAHNLYAYEK